MFFDLTNLYELDASLQFGANATFIYKNFTFGVYAKNLFNEHSFSNGMMGTNGPLYFIEAPRNFHIDIRWNI